MPNLTPFRLSSLAVLTMATTLLAGCKKDDDKQPDLGPDKQAVVTTYATIVSATYDDALAAARTLDTKAQAFVAAPSAAGLEEVKAAWKAAREPYNQTDAFRFYGGPIDDADGPEGLLNAWPLDEAYIDYVSGNSTSGLINNTSALPTVSKTALVALNEQGGEKNISVGYHVVEFLLWGQDQSASGPGARSFTDYTTAPNADRRKQYLTACTSLIVDHLQAVATEWTAGSSGNYRAQFLALPLDSALQRIGVGLGSLSKGELAGERLQVALDNQDQEDEHSCFSDNTDRDVKGNERGIWNVLNGSYIRTNGTTVSGQNLITLVKLKSGTTRSDALKAAADDALAKVNAIQAPFDQEIVGADAAPGRQRVRAAVLAARAQADQLVQAFGALGIPLSF